MSEAIATVNDYPGLQRAMRERAAALKISRATLNDMCGLQEGHVEKLLSDPPKKNMGILSFGAVLQALGLKLVVTEDEDMMAAFEVERIRRNESQVRMPNAVRHPPIVIQFTRSHMQNNGRLIGEARKKKIPNWKRRALARNAARIRWQGKKKRGGKSAPGGALHKKGDP